MKNVPLKNWLKKIKNYYKTVRWLRENNVKGEVEMDKEFYDFLSKLTNVILLAPLDYLIIYWGLYCQGCTYEKLVDITGYSKRKLYRLHKNFQNYLSSYFNFT